MAVKAAWVQVTQVAFFFLFFFFGGGGGGGYSFIAGCIGCEWCWYRSSPAPDNSLMQSVPHMYRTMNMSYGSGPAVVSWRWLKREESIWNFQCCWPTFLKWWRFQLQPHI